tara:strand:- start:96 stop:356 length:261 start_codon:yes stop_codon:yes gene_type:complete
MSKIDIFINTEDYKNPKVEITELEYLKSVGSFLDIKKGIIYPALNNNKADMNNPISLKHDEVNSEWYNELSSVDMHKVNLVDINRL